MGKSSTKKPKCHIHHQVDYSEIDGIRENVCVSDVIFPIKEYKDGKHYCLFHYPSKSKNIEKFNEVLKSKMDEIKESKYDFRYVWFPSIVGILNFNFEDVADFVSATFSEIADFSSSSFSNSVSFRSATFSKSANFSSVKFSGEATFWGAKISKANFKFSTFSDDADFRYAEFFDKEFESNPKYYESLRSYRDNYKEVDFRYATFSKHADFSGAIFKYPVNFSTSSFLETSHILFRNSVFKSTIYFGFTLFAGYVSFKKDLERNIFGEKIIVFDSEKTVDFQGARLSNPERISFHRVQLRPSWFVNTDSRKMNFTDVDWKQIEAKMFNSNIRKEIKSIKDRLLYEPKRLLEISCRQLAVNAEENKRLEEASKFRYMAMETKRLESWRYRWFWSLNWWYWVSSGYGERSLRAIIVLLVLIFSFGVLYMSPLSSFDYGTEKSAEVRDEWSFADKVFCGDAAEKIRFRSMTLCEGVVHSLYVTALQRPEPKSANFITKLFIFLQTIFGPLQAALLALAIRRKFMR